MMEQVRTLLELQEILGRIRSLEEEKKRVPLEVADLKSLFEEREARFLGLQQEFEKVRGDRREKERAIEEERDKVEKAKAKLMGIKTNKEYYAMLKEIEQTKRANSEREEEVLGVIGRYEELEKQLAGSKEELDEVEGRYRERMTDVEARMAEFDREIGGHAGRKDATAASLPKDLLRRFELIFDRREGVAIVAARSHSCTGCHMNLSPQLFNQLQREDRIYTCPNCNRILYYEPDAAEGEVEAECAGKG